MIEVIHFPNPICTVKFSSPVVQSATARGTRWNASPLPKRTAIIPNMVNCRFPLPLRIIYRFYCGRFCIKCFPCLCVPLSDIKAVQGDSGHAQVNMITDAYSHIPVSYTHLTLPTNREVEISVVAVSLKKKKDK